MLVFLHPRVLSRVSRFPVASRVYGGSWKTFEGFQAGCPVVLRGRRGTLWHSNLFDNVPKKSKLEKVSYEMLVLVLPRVSSRVSGLPVASPCLWRKLRAPHSTLYTPHSTLHSTLYILHFTLPHSSPETLHSTLHTLHYTLHFPLLTPHSTLYTPLHTLTLYTPHSTLYTTHSLLYTPHFTLHTFHSTLHTLHSSLRDIPDVPSQRITDLEMINITPFTIETSSKH